MLYDKLAILDNMVNFILAQLLVTIWTVLHVFFKRVIWKNLLVFLRFHRCLELQNCVIACFV